MNEGEEKGKWKKRTLSKRIESVMDHNSKPIPAILLKFAGSLSSK